MAAYRRLRHLKGRRIAVLAADGLEKIELTMPVAALRHAGAQVDVISLRQGRIGCPGLPFAPPYWARWPSS